jgi:hypothetical protein
MSTPADRAARAAQRRAEGNFTNTAIPNTSAARREALQQRRSDYIATADQGIYGERAQQSVRDLAAATTFTGVNVPLGGAETRATELSYTSFPENLEQSGSPYMLIKIFETITGEAPVVDPTTQSIRSGFSVVTDTVQKIADTVTTDRETQAGVAIGLATGSFLLGGATAIFGQEALDTVQNSLGVNLVEKFKTNLQNFNLKRNSTQLAHAIALFMPDGLNANYDQEYDAISITQTLGLIGTLAQAVSDKNTGGDIDPYVMEAASAAASRFLGDDFQKVGLFATTGRTVNPQLELMYTSPNLRKFTFDFRLIPRNAVESSLIQNILFYLKFYSAPRIPNDTSGRYFIPPAQFEIEFYNSPNNSNAFLFKTKKCALTSISVDYSPNGFATFANGAPVETRLQLQFQETTILDRNAITEGY